MKRLDAGVVSPDAEVDEAEIQTPRGTETDPALVQSHHAANVRHSRLRPKAHADNGATTMSAVPLRSRNGPRAMPGLEREDSRGLPGSAMSIEASYNFRRVSDTVTTSGLITPEVLVGLGDAGYELLVNLLPDSSEHAVDGEAAIVERQGVAYVYIPIDFASPRHDQLEQFAEVMDAHPEAVIHMHCAANYRVSAFYGLYAVRKGWWSDDEADRHIHSIWTPDEPPPWRDFIASERARATP